ncbi:MAG: hypothetical protein IT462_03835 [Planctomycetes bacterium]|nr:hypothetical protein [Planctomycetota bacterium]
MFEPEKIIDQQRNRGAARIMLAAALAGLVLGAAIFLVLMTVSNQVRA